MSTTGDPTNRPGHDLHLGIDLHSRFNKVLTGRRSVISLPRQEPKPVNAALIDSHQVWPTIGLYRAKPVRMYCEATNPVITPRRAGPDRCR